MAAQPGLQRRRGPHGTSAAVARPRWRGSFRAGRGLAGGAWWCRRSGAVQPVALEDRAKMMGRFRFGSGPRDAFVFDEVRDVLGITRVGATRRNLHHRRDLAFSPIGAEAVRITFVRAGDRVDGLTIADPDVLLSATKEP